MADKFELADCEFDCLVIDKIDQPERGHVMLETLVHGFSPTGVYLYSHEMRDLAKWLNATADEIDKEGQG
jgi:hypothetical protein